MPRRRMSTRGGSTTPALRPTRRGGIRKNTRNRQPPNRYGQPLDELSGIPDSEEPNTPSTASEDIDPSDPLFSHSPSTNTLPHTLYSEAPPSISSIVPPTILSTPSVPSTSAAATPSTETPINLTSIRALLRSHEQDIVEQVVLQLRPDNATPHVPAEVPAEAIPQGLHHRLRDGVAPPSNLLLTQITELESQLAQLREENDRIQPIPRQPRELGMYPPLAPSIVLGTESASRIAESVEILFPGVERATLIQIIENRFKPTNIYRLLATEKDRAESQRTINIGGVEFEQAERDGKEGEYRMTAFFKAWAAYGGILVKLAPHALQGELATALTIYTMNVYDLLEKYTWEGVRSYHFQFHRKCVASGKNIYQPEDWRQLDSELVASKCFAHPTPRPSWPPTFQTVPAANRRIFELPYWDTVPGTGYTYPNATPTPSIGVPEQCASYSHHALVPPIIMPAGSPLSQRNGQACRNWNYRECRSSHCRYQHLCISCGSNHRLSYCPVARSGSQQLTRTGPARH